MWRSASLVRRTGHSRRSNRHIPSRVCRSRASETDLSFDEEIRFITGRGVGALAEEAIDTAPAGDLEGQFGFPDSQLAKVSHDDRSSYDKSRFPRSSPMSTIDELPTQKTKMSVVLYSAPQRVDQRMLPSGHSALI